MALARDLSKAQIAFQVAGRDVDQFQVVRYRGTEGLCQLYRFEIELAALEEGIILDSLVGKPAVLSINTAAGERWFHGIIGRMEVVNETVGQTYFRAELVPGVWLLTHRYHSRIFQGKTVKEIVAQVLTEGGVPTDRVKYVLSGTYAAREYCVQYRETDYSFISRLMEEEGIWWCFEHSQDKHVLVIADAASAYTPIEGDANLIYRAPSGMNVETEHIYRFRIGQAVRPGAVVLNDFNFEKPKIKLEGKDDAGRDQALEFSDHPGEFPDQARGTALAKLRKEEFQASRIIGAGLSNCKRLSSGRTFTLAEYPSASFNGAYLVTEITHEGKQATLRTSTGDSRTSILDARVHQSLIAARENENPAIGQLAEALLQVTSRLRAGDPTARRALTAWLYHAGQVSKDLPSTAAASGGNPLAWLTLPNLIEDLAQSSVVDYDAPVYQCRFSCIPGAVSFRPPRVTPWPVMRGTQTARVVGPDGEEIHTDKYGRVKVQFNWDREGKFDENSSCFIRVCQGLAGGNYGILFLPRVGQEVIVDFLEGDPDQPIIIGRVYNDDHMPPYELPKEKTKAVIKTNSSKGGGGTNEIRFEDLKDKEQLFIQAQRQMDTNVKASHFHTAGGSYHLLVGGEKDGEKFGEYRQKVFKLKQTHVGEERRAWIEKDDSLQVDGSRAESIGGTLSVTVGKDVVEAFDANHKHEVAATYACKAADVKIEASGTIELSAGGSSIVLCSGGVYIVGSMVYINSGSGPSVSPPSCTAAGPATVDDPAAADSSKPGKDTRYGPQAETLPTVPPPAEVPGHEFPGSQPSPTATHFIEIQLVDELDKPVAGERYDITTPDGKVRYGTTDANGHARENNLQAGQCQIKFPRLDSEAWEKIP
jgi:Rhs element Vgr protein